MENFIAESMKMKSENFFINKIKEAADQGELTIRFEIPTWKTYSCKQNASKILSQSWKRMDSLLIGSVILFIGPIVRKLLNKITSHPDSFER